MIKRAMAGELTRPARGLSDFRRRRLPCRVKRDLTLVVMCSKIARRPARRNGILYGADLRRNSARISANAGVVQRRRRCSPKAKSLKINKRSNAGVARSGLQNRGLQVRFLPGLFE